MSHLEHRYRQLFPECMDARTPNRYSRHWQIRLNNDDIERVMEENRVALNAELPAYSQISKMKIYPEEFEKTPKKSIKRFLYQEAKG